MEGVGKRKNVRKVNEIYDESQEAQTVKKWTSDEKEKLLRSLKLYGHKNLDKIQEELPNKSKQDIRRFLMHVHAVSRRRDCPKSDVKFWLEKSISEMEKSKTEKLNDYYHTAQIMKFLSIDGLLENHPNPENCGGIDFSAAYRLIYQSLMGYPVQPVNKATADFIFEHLPEENDYRKCDFAQDLTEFLKNKFEDKEKVEGYNSMGETSRASNQEKKRAVYVRKRCRNEVVTDDVNKPPLKIFLEEVSDTTNSMKCYSLAIGDEKNVSTVAVPIVNKVELSELEKTASQFWKNAEFNPLELPEKWSRAT